MCIKIIRNRGTGKNRSITGKIIIGVIGTHIGVGATHFSVLLSNYMSECLGKKTAYIECFPQTELKYMEEFYCLDGNATSIRDYFSIYKVHYYKNVREEKIAKIMGNRYDCVVLDLGVDANKTKNEFLRCDKKIVVSNLAPWKSNELEEFLVKTGFNNDNVNLDFGISFSTKKVVKEISKEYKIPTFMVPYEPDPFAISNDTIKMFQKLI